jgi:predicted small secreted protein
MKYTAVIFLLIGVTILTACSPTKRGRDVQVTGFLGPDAALLRKGSADEAPLVYRKANVDWSSYNQVLLDPVTFWSDPMENQPEVSSVNKQILVNYFHQLIYNSLAHEFTMVTVPAPHTLRIKVAITKAEKSHVVLDVVSTLVPQLRLISGLKDLLTGKPAFVGEAQIEYKITDAETGKLLAEGAANRVGGKTLNTEHLTSWVDVEEAFQFWVAHAIYKLCLLQEKPNCASPT